MSLLVENGDDQLTCGEERQKDESGKISFSDPATPDWEYRDPRGGPGYTGSSKIFILSIIFLTAHLSKFG